VTRYLEADDVMQVLDRMGGRTTAVRDGGLLVSALIRPRAQFDGVDVYPSMGLKAAALLTSLATSNALQSNNLRVAWLATRLFCAANGAPLAVAEDDAVETVRQVVSADLGLQDLATRLGAWMIPPVEGPVAVRTNRGVHERRAGSGPTDL
jgi:death-on-curing protein